MVILAEANVPDSLGKMLVLAMSAKVGQTEKRVKLFSSWVHCIVCLENWKSMENMGGEGKWGKGA